MEATARRAGQGCSGCGVCGDRCGAHVELLAGARCRGVDMIKRTRQGTECEPAGSEAQEDGVMATGGRYGRLAGARVGAPVEALRLEAVHDL